MTDFKKMRALVDNSIFPTQETRRERQSLNISEQVINKVFNQLENYFKEFDIDISFEEFQSTGLHRAKESYKNYLEIFNYEVKQNKRKMNMLKRKPLTIFKDYIGNEKENIFSYIEQITNNSKSTHIKFINVEVECYKICRKVISDISNVPINILNLKDEKLFYLRLDEFRQGYLEDAIEKEQEKNPEYLNDSFEKMRLKYILELQNETVHKIGLNELEKFPHKIPHFITTKTVLDNKLLTHMFIEGYHGTGKTTLAQQIAFAIDKENSFYVNSANFENKIITDKDKGNIRSFIQYVHYYGGTIVIDDMNKNIYAKTFARECLKEAENVNLKLIFISTLEQHNHLTDIKTFSELFHKEAWDDIKQNNLYIELSAQHKNDKNKIQFLENFLIN